MPSPLHLFDACGIELEYMIVDAGTLDVRPISDRVLLDDSGEVTGDVDRGELSWSNELTHHVIELKTASPAADLAPLLPAFQHSVREINERLAPHGARLLPSAMHPWMKPDREMELWPHEHHAVYEAFDRLFDCRGHGWANLQSMHINLPFAGDEEFGRLHAAIRLLLPLLPAMAASSPFVEGRLTGQLDSRLDEYRRNARRFASITGRVIPEPVYDEAEYNRVIFQPMYRDVAPHDPQGVLQHEFLNARGAIARFSRGAIEIRVIDVQEAPCADLAIAAACVAGLRAFVNERWSPLKEQQQVTIDQLEPVLLGTIARGGSATISDPQYLRHLGINGEPVTAADVWQHLLEKVPVESEHATSLQIIARHGTLAERIVRAAGAEGQSLRETYQRLADCLAEGRMFVP